MIWDIESERLALIPASNSLWRALAVGETELARVILRAELPTDWPSESLRREVFLGLAAELEESPARLPWSARIIVARDRPARALVGMAGFKGPPVEGEVEIGYELAPSARGHGYATEAARALITWAFARRGTSCVFARVDPGNRASIRVLERLSMTRIGPTAHPRMDNAERWELRRA